MAVETVDNTMDMGQGSLRQAIININAAKGGTINFALPGGGGTIVTAGLPTITAPVIINGPTQNNSPLITISGNGGGGNGLTLGQGSDGSEVFGLFITKFSGAGLLINSANNTIGDQANVISGNAGSGIVLAGAGAMGNTVAANFIGTDATGMMAVPNGGEGIDISGGATGNTIGGLTDADRNFISGNNASNLSDGIDIFGTGTTGNLVEGNFIGVAADGTTGLGNGESGVYIFGGATTNTIGGLMAGARNVISGNVQDGIDIHDQGTTGNLVQGNFIGVDQSGRVALGNGIDGVDIDNAAGNTVGGAVAAARNIIAGNGVIGSADPGDGVEIVDPGATGTLVQGNLIGLGSDGMTSLRNAGNGVNIFSGASMTTVGGAGAAVNFISGNTGAGVAIHDMGTTGNTVVGDTIGLDTAGAAKPNGGAGVEIFSGAATNIIGMTAAGAGDLISGNTGPGVSIHDTDTNFNSIVGDTIGLDTIGGGVGSAALPNGGAGVEIFNGAASNSIGGAIMGTGDVIAGNTGDGVSIHDPKTTGNTVRGDTIGLNTAGTAIPNRTVGVEIFNGAANNTIGGTQMSAGDVISGNTGTGVFIHDPNTTGNTVLGDLIGTNQAGNSATANGYNGVSISLGASNNTIGGTDANAGNLISGNTNDGISINDPNTTGNKVEGNRIGTDATGTVALGNGVGVEIFNGASGNTIGGTEAGAGNLISGNGGDGVFIHDTGTTGNHIEGNFIGTDASGTVVLGNASYGVEVAGGATDNEIGGAEAGARNVISGNLLAGVAIHGAGTARDNVEGDYIGTDVNGTAALANLVGVTIFGGGSGNDVGGSEAGAGNLISGNAGNGISISGDGTLGNRVEGDYIGTNAAGTAALGNAALGVELYSGTSANDIGGTEAGAGNLISGNGAWGIGIYGSGTTGNKVEGDFIGTTASGIAALGNVDGGVEVAEAATDNDIGGTETGARNVISGNQGDGISIHGSGTTGNLVEGNMVGTDSGGILALGNGANGVEVYAGAADNTIGGTDSGARNVISDNGIAHSGSDENDNGIIIHDANTTGNKVEGNYIGTNVTSTTGLGNFGSGVRIDGGASGNDVGGTDAGAGNIISSNGQAGVTISDQDTTGNTVEGNFIGTDATGKVAVGNNDDGVSVVNGASSNTIGGTDTGAGNTIAFNGGNGVTVGTSTDDQATGNGILGNAIFSNAKLGIDLADDGVTPNSPGGPHSGPNDLQNYPVLTSATSDSTSTTIAGTFNSTPDTTFRIEFFADPAADPSGYGQGQTYLGSISVTTDDDGNATFSTTLTTAVPAGQVVTATATDPENNTSEFALDLAVTSGSP